MYELEQVDLCKVDIEGAEIEMLLGASKQTLLKMQQITIEFHDFLDPALVPYVQSVMRRLCHELKFRRIRLSRGNQDVLLLNPRFNISPWELALARGPVKYSRGVGRILNSLRTVQSTLCVP